MGRTRLRVLAAAGAASFILASGLPAWAAEVENGSFETGDLTGWTADEWPGSEGSWLVYSGETSPLSEHEIPAPSCGEFAAVSDQNDPSGAVLYQDLALEADQTHTLTFTHYYVNWANGENNEDSSLALPTAVPVVPGTPVWGNPDTLDPDYDGVNQQYRVDIVDPAADPFSLAPDDILLSIFATEDGDPAVMAPVEVSVDLSQFAGQTVRLRFAQADNEYYLNAGVDCVAVASSPLETTTTTAAPTTTAAVVQAAAVAPRFTG